MIFEQDVKTITSVGSLSKKRITLSSNAKAFKIIFGQIYPDIIKAIVREIFTNAWDSQKKAGNLDRPIDIHIPTKLEPWFSIRDYGTGMTPQVIDDVYSRVFESTKDSSNDEAGQFGMGSKTPLGYTDAFTVTSYVDGMMYAYDIYIAPDGGAEIDLKAQFETTEPNGLEVSLGVNEDDIPSFHKHVEFFCYGANTPINLNGKKYLNEREILFSGNNWEINSIDGMFVRMGCVLYRIATHHFDGHVDNLTIDVPIGTFQVTGDRENIVYNKESITKLVWYVNVAKQEIHDLAIKRINEAKTWNEAATVVLKTDVHLFRLIRLQGLKYKSWEIPSVDLTKMRGFSLYLYDFYNGRVRYEYLTRWTAQTEQYKLYVFHSDHLTNYDKSKVTKYAKLHQISNVVVVSGSLKKARVFFQNNIEVIDIATIKFPRVKSQAKPDELSHIDKNEAGKYVSSSYCHNVIKDKYYIAREGNTFPIDQHVFAEMRKIVPEMSLTDIYLVPASKKDLITKYNLKSFIEEYDDRVKNAVYDDNHVFTYISEYCFGDDFGKGERVWKNMTHHYLDRCSRRRLILDILGFDYKVKEFPSNFRKLCDERIEEVKVMIKNRLEKILEVHPMLAYIDRSEMRIYSGKLKEIIDATVHFD